MKQTPNSILFVYADASVQPNVTGLGAVIRDERGKVLACHSQAARAMTCNEAEYAALIFALEEALKFKPAAVHAYSDSRLVVEQVLGYISVHSPVLKPWYRRARALRERFRQLTLTHIPRERNQLADAVADEAATERMKAEG
jgi:ribonuclease HI